jgi:1-deoxy-D-xylulose-5-phosphate synthase
MKDHATTLLKSIPGLGWPMIKAGRAMEDLFKKTFFPGLLFEELGLRYIGPVQGHSFPSLIEVFKDAKAYSDGPMLIHCVTRKGQGYHPALENPEHFHGAAPFDVETGEPTAGPGGGKTSYSAILGQTLTRIAALDDKVIAITAAMLEGTGLTPFAEKFPERLYDVGIAEQHAVNFAAGLALSGYKPVCAIYSTFLQRAYDQIYHDVCLQDLPVVFALDRSGIVPDDGPTHQGLNDVAFLRHMPNIVLMAPRDENQLQHMLKAAFGYGHPVAVRFPKGEVVGVPLDPEFKDVPLGQSETLKEGRDLLIAYGNIVYPALEAAKKLEAEGISLAVVDAKFAKPLDEAAILKYADAGRTIVTAEEAVVAGGFGSAVRELLDRNGRFGVKFLSIGLPVEPYMMGKSGEIRKLLRLDADGLAARIREFSGLKNPLT